MTPQQVAVVVVVVVVVVFLRQILNAKVIKETKCKLLCFIAYDLHTILQAIPYAILYLIGYTVCYEAVELKYKKEPNLFSIKFNIIHFNHTVD